MISADNISEISVYAQTPRGERAYALAWSPDNTVLAVSLDRGIVFFDAKTFVEIKTLLPTRPALALEFDPSGQILASGNDRALILWDVSKGTQKSTLLGHNSPIRCVAFSPDGATIASAGSDAIIQLWNVNNGSRLQSLRGHTDWIMSMAFSPDGGMLASGSADGTVRLWDLATGSAVNEITAHAGGVFAVAFSSSDGSLVTGGNEGMIRRWDPATGALVDVLQGGTGTVSAVALSSDGKRLAWGGMTGEVHVKDGPSEDLTTRGASHSGIILGLEFSPDAEYLASVGSDYSVRVWDPSTGVQLETLVGGFQPDARFSGLAYSQGGKTLFTSVTNGSTYEPITILGLSNDLGDVLISQEIPRSSALSRSPLLLSPDGRWLFRGGLLLDLVSGQSYLPRYSSGPLFYPMAASIEGHSIVWSIGYSVVLLDLPSQGPPVSLSDSAGGFLDCVIERLPRGSPACFGVELSPDARQLYLGTDYGWELWDLVARKKLLHLDSRDILQIDLLDDGRTLATLGRENSIVLWDTELREIVGSFPGEAMTFSGDDRLLAALADGRVTVWEWATGRKVAQIQLSGESIYEVAFNPQGWDIATVSMTGLTMWRLPMEAQP